MDDGYRAVKEIVGEHPGVAEGMGRLLDHCQQRYSHPAWDDMRQLDYVGDAQAMHAWFVGQLPIPDRVEVIWFALWDVTTGFDLRGSSSWSRDPEDWEWWFRDDFAAGSYESPALNAMHGLARQAEDPDEGPDVEGGVLELTDGMLTLGYVSLAMQQVIRGLEAPSVLSGRDELWAVSGFPDAVYGIILGRLTPAGFDSGKESYRERRAARRDKRVASVTKEVPLVPPDEPAASTRLYELVWDDSDAKKWLLGSPVDGSGRRFEPDDFHPGVEIEISGGLFIPLQREGVLLDLNVAPRELVASERTASLLGELAPQDLQRIPARVESTPERYEFLHTLSWIDCVDRERTQASIHVGAGEPPKKGTLSSLAPEFERDPDQNPYLCVIPGDMRLKTEGLTGPRVFRVEGWDTWAIVTDDVKDALEGAGVRGVLYRSIS